jgi:hypothetical protein
MTKPCVSAVLAALMLPGADLPEGLRPNRFSTDRLGGFLAEGARIEAALAAQAEAPPQGFRINVVKSEPQNNLRKGRATKAVVEVRDRNNKPVAGALVLFALPGNGPSGVFAGGGQSVTVTTNAAGQATATYTPNQLGGMFNLQATAQVNGATVASASIPQANILASAAAAGGMSGTAIGIIAGVAAAAAVGIGVGLSGGGSSPATPGTPVTPAAPTVGIRPGGNPVIGPR